jgi:RND family efflux transporter MFP subunit
VSGPKVKEGELAAITLTAEAEKRLGIVLAEARKGMTAEVRRYTGEAVLPPGRSLTVTAPVSGTLRAAGGGTAIPGTEVKRDQVVFRLTPLVGLPRDLRVTAEADVEQAKTRGETAKLRKARADRLVKDEVGTVRAQEDAQNELELASSALAAAKARLEQIRKAPLEGDVEMAIRAPQDGMVRQVLASAGQVVNGGAALFEVADLRTLWIRVPVYAGEAGQVGRGAAAVETLSGGSVGTAKAVASPPTADGLAATVDLYFELENAGGRFKPGERLTVKLQGKGRREGIGVPRAAVVYDLHGGTWVYAKAGERRFERRRVEVVAAEAGVVWLAAGLAAGTEVVTDGAAELWGTEFGAGK